MTTIDHETRSPADMQAEIDDLQARLARLEQQQVGQERTGDGEARTERSVSRRRFFTTAGAATVAGVAGAVLGGSPAGASSGDNLLIGNVGNNADSDATTLQSTNTAHTFRGRSNGGGIGLWGDTSSTTNPGVLCENSASTGTGVKGSATGSGASTGVLGESSGAGGIGVKGSATGTGATTGVLGETSSSNAAASGVKGTSTFATSPGVLGSHAVAAGTAVKGDASASGGIGVLGQNTAASGSGIGVKGTAASAAAFGVLGENNLIGGVAIRGQSTGGTGVYGFTTAASASGVIGENNAASAVALKGQSTGTGAIGVAGSAATGVSGTSTVTSGTGVLGTTSGDIGVSVKGDASGLSGVGALGQSTHVTLGTGVKGTAASAAGFGVHGLNAVGVGVKAEGGLAPIVLVPGGTTGAPSGSHTRGELYVDSAGSLFLCKSAGSPGTWTLLNDQSTGGAPGLTLLPAPSRVYDSRVSQPNPSGSTQGVLAVGGGARTIDCGPTTPALPAGTTGILFNVTLANMVGGAGSVVVWANGVSEPTTSSINWSAGQATIANAVTSGCDTSQQVQIKCTTGTSTNVILDVIGYYE